MGGDFPPCFFIGLDYNPSVICFANDTSLCTREAAIRVPGNPSSVFAASGESTFPSGKADCLGGRRMNTSYKKTAGINSRRSFF